MTFKKILPITMMLLALSSIPLFAVQDNGTSLEDMLVYGIADEYAAKAEYEAIMKTFNTTRPFSNIVRSENQHITYLLPLVEKYDVTLPSGIKEPSVMIPKTLTEAYEIAVNAEIKNIAMYESFLKEDLPVDVRETFEVLSNASENHLRAFQNALDKANSGNTGYGQGRGFGKSR